MIDDGGVLVVEFHAAFRRQLFDGFADVGGAGDENVAAAVDETGDGGYVQLATEGLDGRCEENQVVVEKFPVFNERPGRIVGRLEGQFEAAI